MASLTELIANVGNTPKIRTSGLKSDYLPETTHKDVLYFSIDSQELLFNGKIYGGDKIPIFTPEEITDESIRNEFLENGLLGDNGTLLYIPDLTNSEDKPSELILNPLSADDSLCIFRRDINEEDKAYFCLSGFVQDSGEESYGPETIIQIYSLQLIDPEKGIWLLNIGQDTIITSSIADILFYDKDQVDTKINDVSTKLTNFLESTDASDTTINRWKEIESFLTGITDTQTLTGLLESQKTELNNSISQKASASDVATLQGKVTTLETDNTNLKARVTALETDNTSLKSQVSELQSAIEDLYRIVTP